MTAAPKKYTIAGRTFAWGLLTFGQFEQIVPILPKYLTALAAGGGKVEMLAASMGPALDIFQVLAGPDVDVRALPADPGPMITALTEVLADSGLVQKAAAPPGGATPRTRKRGR